MPGGCSRTRETIRASGAPWMGFGSDELIYDIRDQFDGQHVLSQPRESHVVAMKA